MSDYTRQEFTYHTQMHRAYRVARAQVTWRVSPFDPGYPLAVYARFRDEAGRLKLGQPEEKAA